MLLGFGTNEHNETIGRFQVTVELNGWDVADLLAGRIANYCLDDDDPARRAKDDAYLASLDRNAIITLVTKALEIGGREEGGLVGNEPDDWYGAYGSGPSQKAVELVRRFLPEFDDRALAGYASHTADENQDDE